MAQTYGTGSNSSIGSQIRTDYYAKKALIEAAKEMYFGQMADTTNMPKNMGKTIKAYHYLPLLDDANINDQGLDASGVATTYRSTIKIVRPDVTTVGNGYVTDYITGEGNSAANAVVASKANAMYYFRDVAGLDIAAAAYDTFAECKSYLTGLTPAWSITNDASGDAVPESGNLYGSSKDVGTITGKLPALSETGGRVNRVGFKRVELEGSLEKFGFFDEYTQESLDFDTDEELMMHINREMVGGANEITEDALQIDLLSSAGILRLGGDATTTAEISGETGAVCVITYEDLMKMSIDLDNNRCPKNTKIISGSRMIDTKTINAARYLYIGTELVPMIKRMEDLFGNQAFISVEKYANAADVAVGEIGTVDNFRIIVVPEMMHWEGVGAAVTTNAGYRETGGNYDVFPMLCIGSGSFTTVGFQTDGKSTKFTITHKAPGKENADRNDPYGETGFMSIKWYYGFMLLRPERIALAKCVAEL